MKTKTKLILIGVICCHYSLAQDIHSPEDIFRQSEQRQANINQLLTPNLDKQPSPSMPLKNRDTNTSATCFPIEQFSIKQLDQNKPVSGFESYVTKALTTEGLRYKKQDKLTFKLFTPKGKTPCLSASKINNISINLQNRLIAKGWVTSRVLVLEQSLQEGRLNFTLMQGSLSDIVVSDSKVNTFTAFPGSKGEVLNLRDLEQGLDNLRRLPTVTAEMNIVPGQQNNASNVEVKWQQRKYPIRLNVSVDDSGGKSTGKYLGTVSVAWDNPLHLNDILSASYTHNLSAGKKSTDPKGRTDKGKTYNYSLNYSVPFGYWMLDVGASHYYYDQVVAGANRNYHYTGDSDQGSVNLSRVIYRDGKNKLTASMGAWVKETRNYVDDAEVDVQHRKTAGWKASLSQRSYFKYGTLNSTLAYKHGTRAFGAIAAPEELFDEGTGKAKIWTADIQWQMPFKLGNQRFNWKSQLHGQSNKTALTAQDKIAIGGRYSVRGFNGEKTLSAERGWYLRNDVAWQYADNHQAYLGVDVGRVSGKSAKNLLGQTLSGAVLGLKGQLNKAGYWNYDVFVGKPIHEPDGFDADSVITGFNFNYSL